MRRGFVVRGSVQGVGFRAAARREAERLGLAGFVRNRADGAVEADAEGEADAVHAFGAWLARGPVTARVDDVEARDLEPRSAEGPGGFEIR